MPDLSAAEWAQVGAAFFTALTALAAWATVLASRRQQREARKPHVTAGFLAPPSGQAQLAFANGGPGLAVAVSYMGVEGRQKYGGMVGNGLMAAGGERDVQIPLQLTRQRGKATFVWMCRDVDNNEHLWAYDGRYKRYSARKVRKGNVPTKFGDLFRVMYPDIAVP